MREGSLESPVRHPIPWQEESFTDPNLIDAELRRVFDICHGCRRCFNLCDSFPRLFDLIDESPTGELDSVNSKNFKSVVDACTLCDMCFLTKCPYVPPHQFNLDFPHLMLRYRAMEFRQGKVPSAHRQLTQTDRNGKLASFIAPLANWISTRKNRIMRSILQAIAGIHKDAKLPKYFRHVFINRQSKLTVDVMPSTTRKAVLYATCFVNFNNPGIGEALQQILDKNGIFNEVVYPGCCGMPQLEQGDISRVAASAKRVAADLITWVQKGYDIIALTPSCALMLKQEWPLILPEDVNVKNLSEAVFDISEYIVEIAKENGLNGELNKIDGGITVHIACHARAQNIGPKAAELMRLIPDTEVKVIERCSGHGGSWGVMKENFDVAMKVGRPVARQASEAGNGIVVSECPLARDHIVQGMEKIAVGNNTLQVAEIHHPIQVLSKAYGLDSKI